MPKGDWVIRRRIRYDAVTTASTNQCSVSAVKGAENKPGIARWGRRELNPFSPSVYLVPVKDDEEKVLQENKRRDGKVNFAQPRAKIRDEKADRGRADEAVYDGQPEIGWPDHEQCRRRAI